MAGEIKPSVYRDQRPAASVQPFHDWIREHPPGWIYELVRLILTPIAVFVYRTRAIDTANVPASGGFIIAPNHFSNMDHFFAGVYIRRKLQFMAKSQLYGKSRILDYVFRVGGIFPVRRGHRDEESFRTAYTIMRRGGCVGMYAEGGRSRTGKLGKPRAGVGKLAIESGLPVVPCAIHGSSGVQGWKRFRFPKVTVQYGAPLVFEQIDRPSREEMMRAASEIFDRVRTMYAELDERGRREVIRSPREAVRSSSARVSH